MRSPSAKLRELALLARNDVDALRTVLHEDAGPLGEALGVNEQQLRAIAERDPHDVQAAVVQLVGRIRRDNADALTTERQRAALDAAERLALTARWSGDRAELEPSILLGQLLADATKPWVALRVDGTDVVVSRARLRRAATAMKPFQDLRAFVDSQKLRLRWRGGRGGLDFHPQSVHHQDEALVLRVVLDRPTPRRVERVLSTRPVRPNNTWLADVLADVLG